MSGAYRMMQLTCDTPLPEFKIKDRHHPYDEHIEWSRLKLLKEPNDYHRFGYIKALCGDMQFDKALEVLKECHPTADITRFFKSYCLLHLGNLTEGYALRESRFRCSFWPLSSLCPQWDGKPTDKSVIIWQEGGFGDVIQYARYIPKVMELCPNASLIIDPDIMEFMSFNYERAIAQFNPYNFQLQCSMMSLPYLLQDFEIKTAPYMKCPTGYDTQWALYRDKIGFVGKGNPAHSSDLLRSLTDMEIVRLLMGKDWHSLDPHHTKARDWCDTAGIVANLKLVICSDTAVGHLAGALGVPVWVIMNKHHDWRWAHKWYDSMRIFKCKEYSDWEPVFQAIESELCQVQ